MRRRDLLRSLPLVPLAAQAAPEAAPEAARVKVTGLEVFRIKVNRRGNWILVRLQTSAGLTGIGDASHHGGHEDAQIARIRGFFARLEGRGIFDLEALWRDIAPEVARDGVAPVQKTS
jgi:L-alanine-DL-glutamate epimerase-like enolase superfamily enzyme